MKGHRPIQGSTAVMGATSPLGALVSPSPLLSRLLRDTLKIQSVLSVVKASHRKKGDPTFWGLEVCKKKRFQVHLVPRSPGGEQEGHASRKRALE